MDTESFEAAIHEIVYELKDAVNRLDIECRIIPDFSNSPATQTNNFFDIL